MNERRFQRMLRRMVAIPVTLLVLLAVTLLLEILTLTSSLKWVDHAEQVISNCRQLMRYMVDMETGVRGYHLTGDKTFLEPYQAARPRVPEQLALLLKLTAKNPGQQQRLRELQALDLRWMDYAEGLLRQPVGSPLSTKDFEAGKELMDQIRAKVRETLSVEDQLRDVRYRRATILGNIADGTAVGLSLLVAFLLFTLTRRELYALSSSYERHLRAEEEKTQELKESRESFQITLKSIGDAVVSTDAAGKITFLNPVAQQLTGWDDQAAQGRELREVVQIVDEKSRTEIDDPVAAVSHSQSVMRLSNDLVLISQSQEEYPIELTAAPIRNHRDELVGIVIVLRDISQRRQAEQTLRASERLAQAGR
jgi:PAS domain S-box-containing protein